MTTQPWHLDAETLQEYADHTAAAAVAASCEAHLVRCEHCRSSLAALVHVAETPRLTAVWDRVVDVIDAPRPTVAERALLWLRVPPAAARLIAVTPALTGAWLLGIAGALVFALAAARLTDQGVAVYLALAPVVPILGVAAAHGSSTDPMHDMAAAAPLPAARLLALRALGVLVPTLVIVLAGALLLETPWVAIAWLLPSLALTALTVALPERLDGFRTGLWLAGGWAVIALMGARPGADPLLAVSAPVQVCAVVVLALTGLSKLVLSVQSARPSSSRSRR